MTTSAPTTEVHDYRDEAFETVRRLAEAKVDVIGNTRALTVAPHVTDPAANEETPDADRLIATLTTPEGPVKLRILPGAHGQFAERTGIPKKYYDRMLRSQPDLLADNLNTWFHEEHADRMLRMVTGRSDAEQSALAAMGAMGSVRAMVSDRYRPIDNVGIVEALIPALAELDEAAIVSKFSITDDHFHLRIVNADARTLEMLREQFGYHDGAHTFVNEILRFGITVRNSETGNAAFSVSPFFDIVRCLNGYVVVEKLRVAHLGGRTEAEEQFMATETKRLEDAALFLKAKDRMIASFADAQVKASTEKILLAQGETIEPEVPMMTFVEGLGSRFKLTGEETDILKDEFVKELPASGRGSTPTKWTLAQAMTATARRVGDEGGSFERRAEMEEIGFKMLGDPVKKLLDHVKAKGE